MVDCTLSSSASPLAHSVATLQGKVWTKNAGVAIESPPDTDVDPRPEAQWSSHTMRQWIEQGATSEPHWSFLPLAMGAVPAVKRGDWSRNDLDRFILARLESEGLAPSNEATKETLIRRLSLDLTGLPPTLAEADAFLDDDSKPSGVSAC